MNDKRAKMWLALICLTYTLVLGLYGYERHARMRSASYDLGIFNQGLYLMSQGEEPFISVRGVFFQEDHFQPILHLVAPFYHIWSSPVMLIFFQTFMLGLGAIPAYLLARHYEISREGSLLLAAVYLCQPIVQFLNVFDFHSVSLMTTALMFSIWALECGPAWAYALALAATLSCTEAAGFTVLLLAANAFRVRGVKWGVGTAVMAVGGLLLAKSNSAFYARGGASPYSALYAKYGSNEVEVLLFLLTHPLEVARDLLIPVNLFLVAVLLGGMAFLPVLAPTRLFPTAANMFGNLLSWRYAQHRPEFHYGAALAPFLFWAAVAGWAWWVEKKNGNPRTLHGLMVLTIFLSLYFGPLGPRHSSRVLLEPRMDKSILAPIQAQDVVSADNLSGPHLSLRKWLFVFPSPFLQAAWGNSVESLVQQSAYEYPPIRRPALRRGLESTQVDWILMARDRIGFPVRPEDEAVCRRQVRRSRLFAVEQAGPNLLLFKRTRPRDPDDPVTLAWEDVRPRLSDDGSRVAFQVNRATTADSAPAAFGRLGTDWSDVVVVDRGSGEVRRIRSQKGHCQDPVLSGDGRLLAYSSLGQGAVTCIYLQNLETQEVKELQPLVRLSGRGSCFAPELSQDGSLLTALTYRPGRLMKRWRFSPAPGTLNTARDTGFKTPFEGDLAEAYSSVAVSPSGHRTAWERRTSADNRVVIAEAEGEPKLLYEGGSAPVLSQDKCAFVAPDHRDLLQIMVHDFDTGETRALTAGNDDSVEPSLSSDGRWLAFTSYASDLLQGEQAAGKSGVYLADLETGALTRVTPADGDGSCYNPDLSGDGSTVAFATLATNLEASPRARGQIYLWDRESGSLELMPVNAR